MGFFAIAGQFELAAGNPDGDSVRFRANDDAAFELLSGVPVEFKADGTVQLRYEGIDSVEKTAIQPLAKDSKEKNFELLRQFSSDTDSIVPGYILSKATDRNRRPVCFVFPGSRDWSDGDDIFLDADLLQESVNYKMVATGYAYTMFYHSLYAELRRELAVAFQDAAADALGLHAEDATRSGVTVVDRSDLAIIAPIFPKLWRRLEEYTRNNRGLGQFKRFIERKSEKLYTVSDARYISFDNAIEVDGDTVRLLYSPIDMVFVP